MQAIGSVSAPFAGQTHSRAQEPLAALRRQDFIASKLLFVALALAGAPVFVAARGVPTPGEAAIFALALSQVVAAVLVARRGRLAVGETVGVIGLAGIGGVIATLPSAHPFGVAAWVLAAAADAAIAGGGRRAAAVMVAGAGAVATSLPAAFGGFDGGAMLLATAAGIPILLAAWRGHRLMAAAMAAARNAEARERALAEIGGAAVIDLDPSGLVRRISHDGASRLGIADETLQGRGLFEHIQVADRPQFLQLVSDAVHLPGRHAAMLRLRSGDRGSPELDGGPSLPCHLAVEMRAVRNPAGGGVIAVMEDVSDALDAEAARDEAERVVAEALRARDEFLANVSHELRTPLNAVIGFSEMLASPALRPADAEKQRDYARIILQSGQHLLSVVGAILDMSKIQSGSFALQLEEFDIRRLVEQCLDMMQLKAQSGRIDIRHDVPDAVGSMRGDRRACQRIIVNLLSNAIKFTPADGEVSIVARVEGPRVLITVRDTGIGIAAADLGKLGQPFFQADGAPSRTFEGTGLGLSVVRGLVGLHGGDLAITSEPGRGTTAAVRLPLAGPDVHAAAGAPAPRVRGLPPHPDVESPMANVARLPAKRAPAQTRMKRSA